jgi:hypothetical protein
VFPLKLTALDGSPLEQLVFFSTHILAKSVEKAGISFFAFRGAAVILSPAGLVEVIPAI